jgi:protein-S-isoprenylcysteine O-methyltransferase Ste14
MSRFIVPDTHVFPYIQPRRVIVYAVVVSEIGACIMRAGGNPFSPNPGIHMVVKFCPTSEYSFDKLLYPEARLSSLALAGCLISTAGALFRLWGMRSLGKFYTWEVSIRPGHKLCTDAPYSIVRHPGYAGSIVCLGGHVAFALGSRGTFVRECIGGTYPLCFAVARWVLGINVVFGISGVIGRSVTEDRLLKKTFGKEWEEWSSKTRYRLFPGVF